MKIKNILQKIIFLVLLLIFSFNIFFLFLLHSLNKEADKSIKMAEESYKQQKSFLNKTVGLDHVVECNSKIVANLVSLREITLNLSSLIQEIKIKSKKMLWEEEKIDEMEKEVAERMKDTTLKIVENLSYNTKKSKEEIEKVSSVLKEVEEKEFQLLRLTDKKLKFMKMIPGE